MGYRFHSRQKTYSIGPYGNGKDGTFSLADARRERDKAKDLLKEGKDPSTEKQLDKHKQAAARPFEQWADEWLAKKKVEKVKRGRIVAVRDPKTIEVLELRVGYVKTRFGKEKATPREWLKLRRQRPLGVAEIAIRPRPAAPTVAGVVGHRRWRRTYIRHRAVSVPPLASIVTVTASARMTAPRPRTTGRSRARTPARAALRLTPGVDHGAGRSAL